MATASNCVPMILQNIKTRSQFLFMLHLQISISFTLRHYIFQQLVPGKVVLPLPAQSRGMSAVGPVSCSAVPQLHGVPSWGSWCRAEQLNAFRRAAPASFAFTRSTRNRVDLVCRRSFCYHLVKKKNL